MRSFLDFGGVSLSLDALNLASDNKENDLNRSRRTRFFIPSHAAVADASPAAGTGAVKFTFSSSESAMAPSTSGDPNVAAQVAATSSSMAGDMVAPKAVIATCHIVGDVQNVVIASIDAHNFGKSRSFSLNQPLI